MSVPKKYFKIRFDVPKGASSGKFESEVEVHFGVPWKARFDFEEIFGKSPNVWFNCEEDGECKDPDDWRVSARVKATIYMGKRKYPFSWREESDFTAESYCDPFLLNLEMENHLRTHLRTSKAVVEVEVEISTIFGVDSQRMVNMLEKEVGWTDVVLKVEDRAFHVNRASLARVSPVFTAMLLGGFKEATDSEVVIRDVAPELFEIFLEVCHHSHRNISADIIPDLLELAAFYDVPAVRDACEHHLILSSEINTVEQFKLAEKYEFDGMMAVLFAKITSMEKMKKLMGVFEEFGPKTRGGLFRKMLELGRERSIREIRVRSARGTQYMLNVEPYETVASIAEKAARVEGNPPERQCLSLNGRVLENDRRAFEFSQEDYWVIDSFLSAV